MAWQNKFPLSLKAVTLAAATLVAGCNVGKTDTVAATSNGGATSGTTTTGGTATNSTCMGSYVGSIDPPTKEVRIAVRDRWLRELGVGPTGNDAVDNANTGGGGVDGGMYLQGDFKWQTDANCNVISGLATIFGYEFPIDGKVNADKTFNLNYFGPIIGSVDANNRISGELQEGGKEWVHGVLNGVFTPNGTL